MSEMDAIRDRLWTDPAPGAPDDPATRAEILEQYKLCLEFADRISQRRAATNTFFLTFHTAIIAAFAGLSKQVDARIAGVFFVIAIGFCIAWWLLLSSYRSLNTAKFQVIGALEERLAARPIYYAEWTALGEGKDWKRHIPLTPIEQIVPVGFIVAYGYLLLIF
ncbi:MAG: hypothetical protein AAFW01_00140 [Pseudomonadota bacterium]